MNNPVIVSINCAECHNAKFLVIQIENDLYLACISCGYMCNIQETIVNQLSAAKKELNKK